jgi:ketosteroid isomerase-like protein
MSSENVELVRELVKVYNERSFEKNMDLLDRDIVWDLSRVELPDGASFTGHSGLRTFVETWEEGFDSEHIEAEEMLDAGERVVAMIHHRGRGRISGIEVDQRFAMVWTLRGGRAVRMDMYPSREEALEAAGLEHSQKGR